MAKKESNKKSVTGSINFQKWFGNSKVVDENNNPIIVYHGGMSKINVFDERYGGDTTANNEHGAFYFSDNYDVAEDYSRQAYIRMFDGRDEDDFNTWIKENYNLSKKDIKQIKEDSENWIENNLKVTSVYLNFKNPFILDMKGELIDTQKMQEIIGFLKKGIYFDDIDSYIEPVYDQDTIDSYKDEIEQKAREDNGLEDDEDISEWQLNDARIDFLNENGIYADYPKYDGIIVKNTIDDIGDRSKIINDVYIAFEPTQIKSADGKNTTFDENNPDIRFGKGGNTPSEFEYSIGGL
jgi:hypothetical protein